MLYYAYFSDLIGILGPNWKYFEEALGDQNEAIVLLNILRRYRNADSHRRELSSYEKQLITGICAEMRTRIARFLAMRDTPDEYFPRIDKVRDSLGRDSLGKRATVRVGDEVEIVVDAWDPRGEVLQYRFELLSSGVGVESTEWSSDNRFIWKVTAKRIGVVQVSSYVKSPREHHLFGNYDVVDWRQYVVLP